MRYNYWNGLRIRKLKNTIRKLLLVKTFKVFSFACFVTGNFERDKANELQFITSNFTSSYAVYERFKSLTAAINNNFHKRRAIFQSVKFKFLFSTLKGRSWICLCAKSQAGDLFQTLHELLDITSVVDLSLLLQQRVLVAPASRNCNIESKISL